MIALRSASSGWLTVTVAVRLPPLLSTDRRAAASSRAYCGPPALRSGPRSVIGPPSKRNPARAGARLFTSRYSRRAHSGTIADRAKNSIPCLRARAPIPAGPVPAVLGVGSLRPRSANRRCADLQHPWPGGDRDRDYAPAGPTLGGDFRDPHRGPVGIGGGCARVQDHKGLATQFAVGGAADRGDRAVPCHDFRAAAPAGPRLRRARSPLIGRVVLPVAFRARAEGIAG